jgi:hypothetical protein
MKNITLVTGKMLRLCQTLRLFVLPELIRRICLEREAIVVLLPNEAAKKQANMPGRRG